MEQKRLDYSCISNRRNDLFGISIVSIMIFHFTAVSKMAPARIFNALIGTTGVPVFLILSGMGLFFSMSKNADLKLYYKKRVLRVVIPYTIIASLHFLISYVIISGEGFVSFLKAFFFLDFILKGRTQFWFIALILVMYLIFPLLFKVFQSGKKNFLKLCILLAICVATNYAFSKALPDIYKNIEVMLTRIPAFIIGVYIGEKVYNKRPVQMPFWFISMGGSAAYLYFSILRNLTKAKFPMVFIRYSETCWALFLVLTVSIVLDAVNSGTFSKICAFFGSMSLELYMIHVSLRHFLDKLEFSYQNPLVYAAMIAVAIVLSFLFNKLNTLIAAKLLDGKKKV